MLILQVLIEKKITGESEGEISIFEVKHNLFACIGKVPKIETEQTKYV